MEALAGQCQYWASTALAYERVANDRAAEILVLESRLSFGKEEDHDA